MIFDFGGVFIDSPFTALANAANERGLDPDAMLLAIFGDYDQDTDHPWHRVERGELSIEAWMVEVSRTAASEGVEIDWSVMGSLLGDLEPYPQMEAEARRLLGGTS